MWYIVSTIAGVSSLVRDHHFSAACDVYPSRYHLRYTLALEVIDGLCGLFGCPGGDGLHGCRCVLHLEDEGVDAVAADGHGEVLAGVGGDSDVNDGVCRPSAQRGEGRGGREWGILMFAYGYDLVTERSVKEKKLRAGSLGL